MDGFLKYQLEAEERFKEYEEEWWKKEVELEDKRQQEYQQHEMRMMAMIARMFERNTSHPNYSFNYEHDNYLADYYQQQH